MIMASLDLHSIRTLIRTVSFTSSIWSTDITWKILERVATTRAPTLTLTQRLPGLRAIPLRGLQMATRLYREAGRYCSAKPSPREFLYSPKLTPRVRLFSERITHSSYLRATEPAQM